MHDEKKLTVFIHAAEKITLLVKFFPHMCKKKLDFLTNIRRAKDPEALNSCFFALVKPIIKNVKKHG